MGIEKRDPRLRIHLHQSHMIQKIQREKGTSRIGKPAVVAYSIIFRRILRQYLGSEDMRAEINW